MSKPKENIDITNVISEESLKKSLRESQSDAPPALVLLIGPTSQMGKQWLLNDRTEFVIGRSSECQIAIDDRSLSRQHARISIESAEIESTSSLASMFTVTHVTITDLGSTNKTHLNDLPLVANMPTSLQNNDQIKTGSVVFKFLERGSNETATLQAMNNRISIDALTKAHNRASLLERGPEAIKRAVQTGEELSLIVFDIDFFKKVNDGYGHPAGDFILSELAKIVTSQVVRSNDFFARYGGEEFVIILSATSNATALEIGERLRATVQAYLFKFEQKEIKVTVSVGVATKEESETWEDLFKRGDTALYFSKQNGRNQVTGA
jgi:two-component system cell cycle response regulator